MVHLPGFAGSQGKWCMASVILRAWRLVASAIEERALLMVRLT